MSWPQRIRQALDRHRSRGHYRQRMPCTWSDARRLRLAGKDYLNFSSNDYLGLSHHPQIVSAWRQGALDYGTGAGGSTHLTGFRTPQAALEGQLADWLGYPRALVFLSGFAANQAVITALMAKDDRILADKLSHASLLEAAMLSPATLRRFAHNQPQALAARLTTPCSGETLVITEGVFSMDGDRAPLAALHTLTRQHDGWLLVDDAHGIGICGDEGRGSCWQQGVRPELQIITFGKAFGVSGAAVLCDDVTADYLLQFARHLIYSTAMPPAQICALQAALGCIRRGEARRQRLWANIARFRAGASGLRWRLADVDSAIQPLLVGEECAALALAARLKRQGCWVGAIRPPTVPPGTARLRITLNAAHLPQDIDRLLEVLYDAER